MDVNRKIKCFICGKVGHIAKICRANPFLKTETESNKSNLILIKNKVTRCFVCKKLGHKLKECPKYFDINSQPRRNDDPMGNSSFNQSYGDDANTISQAFDSLDEHDWDFLKNENQNEKPSASKSYSGEKTVGGFVNKGEESKYYKTVILSNIKFTGYLDTCSEKCLIKYSAAKRAHLNVQLDDTDVMANSPTFQGKIVSIGKALTTMSVDSVEIPNMELFIVNDNVLNIDVVVGRSWLDHPNILLLKIENAVHVGDITLHPFDKFASILSSFDVKLTNKRTEMEPRFDALSSGDEDFSKPNFKKKEEYNFLDDFRGMTPPPPHIKKNSHDIDHTRDRERDMGRERSRSRERIRPSMRDGRPGKMSDRSRRSRSRERSRERYMSRHSGRR